MSRLDNRRTVSTAGLLAASPGLSKLLPALLVGTLLLCHGMLGFAHQISCHGCHATDLSTTSTSAAYEHAAGGVGGPEGEDQTGGYEPTEYFAILLTLLAVAVLGLLFAARRRPEGALLRLLRSLSLPVFACLPRGPTPAFLQVFRL